MKYLLIFLLSFVSAFAFGQANNITAKVVNATQSLYIAGTRADSISTDVTFAANSDHNLMTEKAIKTYVSNHITGSQSILGPIYGKSSWTSLTDFTANGGSFSTSGGHIEASCATCGTYHEWIGLNNQTNIAHWRMGVIFKVLNAASSTRYGIAVGTASSNTVTPSDAYGVIDLATGIGNGQLSLVGGGADVEIDTAVNRLTVSQNDQLSLITERSGNEISVSVRNITTNSLPISLSHAYSATEGATTPNTGRFAFAVLGGSYEVDSMFVDSKETVGSKVMIIGDSKSVPYYPNNFTSGYPRRISMVYPDIADHAGGGDKIEDALKTTSEVIALQPSQVLLAIGSNSIRLPEDSTVYDPAYDTLVSRLVAGGIRIVHLLPFAEEPGTGTGVDVSPLVRHILATYSFADIIDTYTPLVGVNGAINSSDGTHPTDFGHGIIAAAIIHANKINGAKTTQDFSAILSQTGQLQNAGFNIGGNSSSIYAPFTIGNEIPSIPQLTIKTSKTSQMLVYSFANANSWQSLNRAGTYGAPIVIAGSSLELGFLTTGIGTRVHIDSTSTIIGDGSDGSIEATFSTGQGAINIFSFGGENILESSNIGRSADNPLRINASYLRVAGTRVGGDVLMTIGIGDSIEANVPISYNGVPDGTLSPASLVPKVYVDSINNIPHAVSTPSTGGTVALVKRQWNIINPSGTLSTLTVTLPSSPANNDRVYIKFTQAITTLTYSGGTVVNGITTIPASFQITLTYDTSTTSWY